ncbi:MAG: helix-turn-helix domain-containing protein [Bacteroidales bacterium]
MHRIYLFFFFLLNFSVSVISQTSYSDTTVKRMLQQKKYMEAAQLINGRLTNKKFNDIHSQLYYYNSLSIIQFRLGDYGLAKKYALKSMNLVPTATDSVLISEAWRVSSYAYNRSGNLDSALYFALKLLDYSKRRKDHTQYFTALISVATIYAQNNKYAESLKAYREVAALSNEIHDTVAFPVNNLNLGIVFLELGQYDSCIFYLNKAVPQANLQGNFEYLTVIYGSLADCYLAMKNKVLWKKYIYLAMATAEKVENYQYIATLNCNLTEEALSRNNYKEAYSYGKTANMILKDHPFPVLEQRVDSMLYVSCKGLSKYAEALQWLEAFLKWKNTLLNENLRKRLEEMSIKYDVAEKNLTISNQEVELSKKQIKNQLLSSALVIILLISLGFLVYIINTRKHRSLLYQKEKYLDKELKEIYLLKQRELLKETGHLAHTATLSQEQLQQSDISTFNSNESLLFIELREAIEKDKLYLNPDLNLIHVIRLLGTNKKYLNEAISQSTSDNFRTLINRYRVNEAKRIIEKMIYARKKLVISEVFYLSGFNSEVSFYRSFHLVTGLTPKEFANEVRKDPEPIK